MDRENLEKEIIDRYKQDEQMMILVFAQWCVNNDLDPLALYRQAYPQQADNPALLKTLELIVPKEEAGEIGGQTVLNMLSSYGNDDLAMIVAEEMEKLKK
ncbi:hypothetical protein [Bacillus marinisedimentorum]|uniref:hypothetical protein n=1 Tax=Bacillus marinisedimentorum TaxID=1821260 RepID=UPI0007E02343|nr:hypothetical protein [Bacillus marinisedimentorum]